MAQVTKQFIENYLSTQPFEKQVQFVGRALVVLFNNQTTAEKQVNTTNEDNGVGFTGADAYSGTLTAKSFLKRGTLQPWQVEKWTKRNRKGTMRLSKYWRQLDAAAKAKAANSKPATKDNEYAKAKAKTAEPSYTKPTTRREVTPFVEPRSWKDVQTAATSNVDADWIEAKDAFAQEEAAMEQAAMMADMIRQTPEIEISPEEQAVLDKLAQWGAKV